MKAIRIEGFGSPSELRLREIQIPEPGSRGHRGDHDSARPLDELEPAAIEGRQTRGKLLLSIS